VSLSHMAGLANRGDDMIEALRDHRADRLYVLDYGLFKVHADGRIIGICGYLIRTDGGKNILVDTGFPAKYAGDREEASRADRLYEFGEVLEISAANLPGGQLALIGLAPADIDCLVMTHTHIDHVGGLADFPGAPLVIGAAERALDRPLYWGDVKPFDWPDVETVCIEGDADLCAGLRIVATPGHSPGHISLLVTLPRTGPVLLTADAISRPAEAEEGFAGAWSEHLARRSGDRLLVLARETGALVIYGHCPDQWPDLRKAPEFYP